MKSIASHSKTATVLQTLPIAGWGMTGAALAFTMMITAGSAHAAPTSYGYENVEGIKIFYREAGDPSKPSIVMLHGFPSSSHQYRDLITDLSDDYHVIAPDYPGFGSSDFPTPDTFTYTFDNLADVMDTFIEQRGIEEYSLVMHDYGAPVGFRIALEHPERVSALLVQNGNAYIEGVSQAATEPLQALWENRTDEADAMVAANLFTVEALQWQYTHGTRNPESILPDNWLMDYERVQRPGQYKVQLDLLTNYTSNIEAYPAWQAYLREHQPPVLVTWGKNDPFFTPPGAEGYARDVKDIEIHMLDTGHFPLEEDGPFIAETTIEFLKARGIE
ncbi:alpha/beta hydrolase [uncultured Tateyamaria sp.]|uniref:alpha/beta fold hydrolase n=1 Tax=uncultured Tateyamaria sp. TaxID=455651 RepID=UPI00263220A6|nr:alpha/beta hydrolase [uncultured Tateyamaria sp.]